MSANRSQSNPFDLVKASDFSDEQINQYWVDLVAGEGRLEDLFKPMLRMPMLLLGGKGSGKTHLMRYYSSTVRKLAFDGSLLKAVASDHYLGLYVRADGLNVGRFDGKGETEDKWAAIFSYYFELWLATHFLKNLQECLRDATSDFDEILFVAAVNNLFNQLQPDSIVSIQLLVDHLAGLRKKIDHVVSNVVTGRNSIDEIEICVSPGELVFGLPELLTQHTTMFVDVLFIYMIDEIENFTSTQQRFLNSLIRYRRGPVSIKIGARLYGIRTNKTLDGAAEEIREGAEYERVKLDEWLRDHSVGYHTLASQLIVKRLQQAEFIPATEEKNYPVGKFFEALDTSNHYSAVTMELVKKYDDRNDERPYFRTLRSHIAEWSGCSDEASAQLAADQIISAIRLREYPLLEKVNVYLLYKTWDTIAVLLEEAKKIGVDAANFLAGGKKAAKSYFEAFDHFKSDFLAQLYRDCDKHRVVYAGLDTLIHLSQGIPRNLLGLLKQIYRRSHFAGERPFQENNKISIASQVDGIRDAAAWFWDDAQPDSHGPEARRAVQALGEFFSGVRFSLKPAECDLGTFTIATTTGTAMAREVLNHAENWSYLVRIQGGGSDRNDANAVDDKYQLSPMLAPRWEVSERRRGAITLTEELFSAMFDPASCSGDDLDELVKNRLKGMQHPYRKQSKVNDQQEKLF